MKKIIKFSVILLFAICAFILLKNTNSLTTSLINSNNNSFSIVLSESKDKISDKNIIPITTSKDVTASTAKISTTIISDINVTFTEPGQTAIYKVYAHNNGNSNAFLKGIVAGRLTCTPGEKTSAEECNKYCSGVSITIENNKEKSFSSSNIDGSLININNHQLLANNSEEIKITIKSSNTNKETGQFNIMVPTISLIYYTND